MELFEALTKIRHAQGLTIADISAKAGIPLSTLAKIFSGISDNPSYTVVMKIAAAMGVTPNEIAAMQSETQVNLPYTHEAIDVARRFDLLDSCGKQFIHLVIDHEIERANAPGLPQFSHSYDDVRQEAAVAQSSRLSDADQAKA